MVYTVSMVKWSELKKQFYKPGEVGELLGLSRKTIFKYTKEGRLKSVKTETGRHLYPKEEVARMLKELGMLYDDRDKERVDVIYARVSSNEQKQKGDLDRQVVAVLEKAGSLNSPVVLKEVGSGLNGKRKQFNRLIEMIENGEAGRIFVRYRDRLTRFGFDTIEKIAALNGAEIIVTEDEESNKNLEEELVEDLVSLIASFSGKFYGLRSRLKKELTDD